MNPNPNQLPPGTKVRVTQQVQHKRWTQTVEGEVVAFGQQKSGSWYAHGKDDKLWLDRLELRKADGELVVINLDRYSRIERLDPAAGSAAARPAAS